MLLVLYFVSITKLWSPKTGVVNGLNGNREDANTNKFGCLGCLPKQWTVRAKQNPDLYCSVVFPTCMP